MRYYEPDFVVLTGDGIHYIVETKGLEDTNVANKDRAAQLWCENTSRLAGTPWAYLKVLQTAYKQLQPTLLATRINSCETATKAIRVIPSLLMLAIFGLSPVFNCGGGSSGRACT